MHLFLRSFLGLLGFVIALPASAADLTRVDRTIGKEPVYKGKPKYCLLVFGPEAKARAWLVLDGHVLYVDRNSNGDLTDEGERSDSRKRLGVQTGFALEIDGGSITEPDGKTKHTGLIVRRLGFGSTTYPTVQISFEGKRLQYAAIDAQGQLQFGSRPQDAPIIHFGGQLEMALLPVPKPTLRRGDKPRDLTALVGTPGVGPGTFAMLMYEGSVPADIHPVAEIEFPPAEMGQEPLKTKAALTRRC